MSFIDVIRQVDSFTYDKDHGWYVFYPHDANISEKTPSIGFVSEEVALKFDQEDGLLVDKTNRTITIDGKLDTLEKRSEHFMNIAVKWKQQECFDAELKHGWRDELYTVFCPTHTPYMRIERAFSVLIGVVTYGVHMNGYVPADKSSNGKLKLWIPRRSDTKQTYPGMLDNTVAGGLGYPNGVYETMVKECYEEAGLDSLFVKSNIKSAGVLLYMYHPTLEKVERVQPEVQYIHDLAFEDETSVVPHPVDGESQDFQLLEVDDVIEKLRNHRFKPNCGMVIIDFLIRHGYMGVEEPDLMEILARCHRLMPFPTM